MAGSKKPRQSVMGHTVMADPNDIKLLRRLGSGEISQLFRQAQEQGETRIMLEDEHYTLHRHSDHTFTLEKGATGHVVF